MRVLRGRIKSRAIGRIARVNAYFRYPRRVCVPREIRSRRRIVILLFLFDRKVGTRPCFRLEQRRSDRILQFLLFLGLV